MNRLIKFRAWNGKQMLNWDWITAMGLTSKVIINTDDTYKLMQFTGLTDKNGKEIYEGDIIKWIWTYGTSEIEEVMHSTSWDGQLSEVNAPFMSAWGSTDGRYYRTFMNVYDPSRFAIVVGNIYQNPELLKP